MRGGTYRQLEASNLINAKKGIRFNNAQESGKHPVPPALPAPDFFLGKKTLAKVVVHIDSGCSIEIFLNQAGPFGFLKNASGRPSSPLRYRFFLSGSPGSVVPQVLTKSIAPFQMRMRRIQAYLWMDPSSPLGNMMQRDCMLVIHVCAS